ncbi:MAG: single-stranded DNA-binding protein [Clostridia bacterium]|nr:single-stranded DNA-binding protein [Clostridia bacterium]
MYDQLNAIWLSGAVTSAPVYDHTVLGEAFYRMEVSASRLSGVLDTLPVTVSERLLPEHELTEGEPVSVRGQIRSYNKRGQDGSHLIVTVFARELEMMGEGSADINEAEITGRILRPVVYRMTPFQREIADLLVAVGRRYDKSDFVPCIAWGRNARFAGGLMPGDTVTIRGRMQSREYQKTLPDGESVQRVAYELSCSSLELTDA